VIDFLGQQERETRAREVESFYDRRPFPGYRPNESPATVLDRGRQAPFLDALDQSLPTEARILDCGCGTAQVASFLALTSASRQIFAVDASRGALAEADGFKGRVGIDNLTLLRADLFRLPFAPGSFDAVISRGVVHHTPDPAAAIQAVASMVAPGGTLILAWYESYARALHGLRQAIFRLRGKPVVWLDPILRRRDLDAGKKETWIDDQYRHPLEQTLAFPWVLRQVRGAGLELLRTVPPAPPRRTGLFTRQRSKGTLPRRLDWLARGLWDADAGLVSLLARRP
jgi:SAM-dependent methyltransferase